MSAIQMFVVKIAAVVLSTIHQFASVCQNTKVIRHKCHVNHQKMHVQYRLADQTHNVLACQMELPSVHAYQDLLKVRTQFVVALNRRVLVNHSHVVWEHLVMLLVAQLVIVQKELLAIHSDNVHYQIFQKSFADLDHADVSSCSE